MKTLKYICGLILVFGITACEEDDLSLFNSTTPLPDLTAGSADFSTFVSVGNSLTAGFTDNALFISAQHNSMPYTMAQQFALVGGGEFTQPLMNDETGGLLLGGQMLPGFGPRLFFDGAGPASLPAMPTTEVSNVLAGPFNNMGVPGAMSFHLLANGYGNIANIPAGLANPYFARMASNPNASMMEDVLAQAPTFVSLWIGNNDVLGYATTGGSGASPITDVPTFTGSLNAIAGLLGGTQGVMVNIPDVTSIPFFTTIPHNALDPSNPDFGSQIAILNAAYAPLNQAFDFLGVPERKVEFSTDMASAVVIHDESLPNIAAQLAGVLQAGGLDPLTAGLLASQYAQSRQATAADLLILPSSTAIATLNEDYFNLLLGLGVDPATAGQLSINGLTYPMEDQWVLLPSEQLEVQNATDSFNSVIQATANQLGYAFVDAYALLVQAANGGVTSGDFTLTDDLVFGGLFSLDGVHLTARGYALAANELLKAIDAAYESNFEASGNLVDIGNFPTNYPPDL